MAARLGNVLYWLCCSIAVLAFLSSAYLFMLWFMFEWHGDAFISFLPYGSWVQAWAFFCAGASAGIWTLGRVCLYILAGR